MKRSCMLLLVCCLVILGSMSTLAYQESPFLAERVQRGELPPVDQRLPLEPYVVEPIDRIGQYGGTLNLVTLSPTGWGDDHMLMSVFNQIIKPDPHTFLLEPHFAKQVDVSDDRTTYTVHFREGVHWSDGEPFTTADIQFWYEHILMNEDLTPVIGPTWRFQDQPLELEVIDDFTVAFVFAGPVPFFLERMAHGDGSGIFHPKHYLSQFHPAFVDADALQRMVEAEGFGTWFELFGNRNSRIAHAPVVEGLPTLGSFFIAESSAERRVYERNPYYWKVDTEGNQLPYVDRMVSQIVGNVEVAAGMIIGGQVDFAGRVTDVRDVPMYQRFEEESNFNTLFWNNARGTHVIFQLNLTHENEVVREIFQDKRFRQALSLAIDRQDISDALYFGHAVPRQYTVLESSQYFRPEFGSAFAEYDPDRASALLDEMGLERTRDGHVLRPDGERLNIVIELIDWEGVCLPTAELVREYWEAVGIQVEVRVVSGELQSARGPANLMDATTWMGNNASDMLFPLAPDYLVPTNVTWSQVWSTEWARWFNTNGREGQEPPAEAKEARQLWEQIVIEADDDERFAMAQRILELQAENLWVIGVVGQAPFPVIVSKDLHNFAELGYWGWDTMWSTTFNPEQVFLTR